MSEPYLIEGPALISFSGGRTSAYMLYQILQAHGGTLPDDVVVAFANTGKEREETLRFVHECGVRWGVPIRWLEWRNATPCFEEVGYNSASRAGEPLAALIRKKGYLPTAMVRFCTQEAKVRTIRDFCRSLGWETWRNVVGLRYDEGHRVLKQLARNDTGKERWRSVMPLSSARVTRRDVLTFWLGESLSKEAGELPQGFDLGLRDYEGNCDLCFLKGRSALKAIMREQPGAAAWWIAQEAAVSSTSRTSRNARFGTEYSYADLMKEVSEQPHLFDEPSGEFDAECGLWCAPDEEAA